MYSQHTQSSSSGTSDSDSGGNGTGTSTDGNGLERTVITSEPEKKGFVESLRHRFKQNVETRTRRLSFGVRHSGVERVKPADDLAKYRKLAEDTPIVRKSLTDFVSDVVEPGYRIETENEAVKEYLEDHWCPQAGIIAGEKHNDFLPLVRQFSYERWRGGDALGEHVRADPTSSRSPITGFSLINPEHVEYITYEEKNVLVDPDAGADVDAPVTKRGEKAAYIQYGDGALISTSRNAIQLSQNDVTRSALDPGAGDLRGTPVTETIADDVAGFKNILRDKEEAIKTKAYGLWSLGFGREVIEYTDTDESGEKVDITEIVEWSDEGVNEYVDEHLEDIEPGAILAHDGAIEMERLDGEVPDLIDDLNFYVSNIVAPLPTPLFSVGFETNINQFVTEKQDKRYQKLIDQEREELERVFTDLMDRVVEQNIVENNHADTSVSEVPDDLQFKLEPQEEESPILSLDIETIEKMQAFAAAYSDLRGDIPADMFADKGTLLELILQLPEDAVIDEEELEDELDETDPDLQRAIQDMGIMDDMTNGSNDSDSDSDSDDTGGGSGDSGGSTLTPPGIESSD